jgi:hypothetical protein
MHWPFAHALTALSRLEQNQFCPWRKSVANFSCNLGRIYFCRVIIFLTFWMVFQNASSMLGLAILYSHFLAQIAYLFIITTSRMWHNRVQNQTGIPDGIRHIWVLSGKTPGCFSFNIVNYSLSSTVPLCYKYKPCPTAATILLNINPSRESVPLTRPPPGGVVQAGGLIVNLLPVSPLPVSIYPGSCYTYSLIRWTWTPRGGNTGQPFPVLESWQCLTYIGQIHIK